MSLIEEMEAELGPLNEGERQWIDRDLDLLAAFAAGIQSRVPEKATEAQRHEAIAQLLYEDPGLFATFFELLAVSDSNPGSPLRSLLRLK